MKEEDLTKLRSNILEDIVPLVVSDSEDPSERFSLLLRLIQSGGADEDIYQNAYVCAKSIHDSRDRLRALMALLDEVDFDLHRQEDDERHSELRS